MKRFTSVGAIVLALATALAFAAQSRPEQSQPPKEDYDSGAYLFKTFCASCHGEDGRGQGPASPALRVPATDLTTIRARAGGVFPRDTLIKVIDGRESIAPHFAGEMPVWGRALRSIEGDDERAIRRRVSTLVDHLETLQR